MTQTWLERVAGWVSPRWALQRVRARMATELLLRHYEGASISRRTQGWRRTIGDANAATLGSIGRLRDIARDLVRNNPYAESALATIVEHTIGWGIVATARHEAWQRWTESPQIDYEGRHDLAGLEKLVLRTVVESGEALVRRHYRPVDEGLALPLRIQVLEPDFLDTLKTQALPDGGRIIQGVEFDARGQRRAYWLFPEHPGAFSGMGRLWGQSQRVPAADVLHVFKPGRPGQVRGVTWFAPVILPLKDFDELADATLMKQKIAALLTVITTDSDGMAAPLGTVDPQKPEVEVLEPGMIINTPPGRQVTVVEPPTVRDYPEFSRTVLRAIATGLGVGYEDLTGDFADLPFSAARMSRLRHWGQVQDWRWRILIPQLLDPLWAWAMQAAALIGLPTIERTDWTAPPLPMIEPDREGLAAMRNIRAGIRTLSETIREQGYDPETFLREMASDWKLVDRLGLVLDSDPRKMTQAGTLHRVEADAGGTEESPRELPPGDLTTAQLRVFEEISRYYAATGEGCPGEYLSRKLGRHRSTIRAHIDALYRKGYLRGPGVPAVPAREMV